MQIKYTHLVRGARAIAVSSAATVALSAAISPAAGAAAVKPIEPQVVTPTSVTPHVVTPAAPSPSSGAPAPSSGPAPTPVPVRGSRRQAAGGSSPADDSPDEGDLPDPKDPACDLDCERQWLAWYTSAYQAAWFKSEDGVPGATELARALTREARDIENEIKAETASEDDGNRITDNNPGTSAGGDPQADGQASDPSVDDSTDESDDLGSWDLSWIVGLADDLAALNQELFPADADTSGGSQPFDPSSVTPDGDTQAGTDWGVPLGSDSSGSGDGSGDSVDLAPLADMFDIGPAIGGGSIPDPNKLFAD